MKYTIPPNTVVLHKAEYKAGSSRPMLLELLERYTSIPAAEIRLTSGPKGKPALDPSFGSDIHFNLSHTNGLVVYAFSYGFGVGVDIEKLRAPEKALRIAKRFFTEDEMTLIESSPNPELSFMRLWTKKEALSKAFGASIWDKVQETSLLTIHEFIPEEGYLGCLVARSPNCNLINLQTC